MINHDGGGSGHHDDDDGDGDGGRDDVSWSSVGEYLIWWSSHKNWMNRADARVEIFQFSTGLLLLYISLSGCTSCIHLYVLLNTVPREVGEVG